MTHLSLITLVCHIWFPGSPCDLSDQFDMKIARTKGQHQPVSLSINKAKKISSFMTFVPFSYYYSWNWIVSSISRAHCDDKAAHYVQKCIISHKKIMLYLLKFLILELISIFTNFVAGENMQRGLQNLKKSRPKIREIDLFDFTSFFGLDFLKFHGPLCINKTSRQFEEKNCFYCK